MEKEPKSKMADNLKQVIANELDKLHYIHDRLTEGTGRKLTPDEKEYLRNIVASGNIREVFQEAADAFRHGYEGDLHKHFQYVADLMTLLT